MIADEFCFEIKIVFADVFAAVFQGVELKQHAFLRNGRYEFHLDGKSGAVASENEEQTLAFDCLPAVYLTETQKLGRYEQDFTPKRAADVLANLSRIEEDTNAGMMSMEGPQPAKEEDVRAVIEAMALLSADCKVQQRACDVLLSLATVAPENVALIVREDGVGYMLRAMHNNPKVQYTQEVMCEMLNIMADNADHAKLIANNDGVECLAVAVSNHLDHKKIQSHAFSALNKLAKREPAAVKKAFEDEMMLFTVNACIRLSKADDVVKNGQELLAVAGPST